MGAAKGLIYLHSNGMVHGDLKGVCFGRSNYPDALTNLPAQANILIDEAGNACLTDFGLLTILSDPANLLSSSSNSQGGSARWMSPELIVPEEFGFEKYRATVSSDCYALGMVVYEVISGNIPFHKSTKFGASLKVLRGERPHRGSGFTESLWKMLEWCWTSHPDDRPNVESVLQCLETD